MHDIDTAYHLADGCHGDHEKTVFSAPRHCYRDCFLSVPWAIFVDVQCLGRELEHVKPIKAFLRVTTACAHCSLGFRFKTFQLLESCLSTSCCLLKQSFVYSAGDAFVTRATESHSLDGGTSGPSFRTYLAHCLDRAPRSPLHFPCRISRPLVTIQMAAKQEGRMENES
ncbi:hypothetical protein AKJ16_DCAP17295 [Drosera capensis]